MLEKEKNALWNKKIISSIWKTETISTLSKFQKIVKTSLNLLINITAGQYFLCEQKNAKKLYPVMSIGIIQYSVFIMSVFLPE